MSLRLIITTKIIILLALPLSATIFDSQSTVASPATPQQIVIEDFVHTKIRDMDDLLGRDFNWKEKLVLRIVRKKLRRAVKQDPSLATHSLFSAKMVSDSGGYGLQQGAAEVKISVPSLLAAISAFLVGLFLLLNLFWGAIIFSLSAVVLGTIGLGQIRRQPERYKGKGFAWSGIVVGGLGIVAFLLILTLVFLWLLAISG